MINAKKILIGLAVIIGLLLVLPFLIPTQTYLQQAEELASVKLGQPVRIGAANVFFLPSPRLTASDIVIGKQNEFTVGRLVIMPTLGSLFADAKILDLQISKPIIKKAALDFLAALQANNHADSQSASFYIRHIEIDDLQLIWPNIKLPIMNADATLSSDYKLQFATLQSADGKIKADVLPNGDEQLIALKMSKWALPVGLPLLIDSAKFEMRLQGSQLVIPKYDIALYGGKISGDATVNWQKNWCVTGRANVANLQMKQPSNMVSKSVYLSGDLFGDGNFSATAKNAGILADNLRADFKFKVNNGVLHGLDLLKVASLLLKKSQSGGQTQFDEFSGLLNVSGKQYHLHDLKISSGLLAASGQVKIMPNKTLNGKIAVDVKKGMGLAEIPLDISGTVSKPIVLPNKAAVAGAIAGTAVLGPAGTSLGMKAGGALDKLKGLFD